MYVQKSEFQAAENADWNTNPAKFRHMNYTGGIFFEDMLYTLMQNILSD